MTTTHSSQFSGQRILLVDDEPSLLELLSIRLSAAGLTIKTASSGAEALSLITQFLPPSSYY